MFKRIVSFILITVMSIAFLSGCSSEPDKPEEFDAAHFVESCRILAPASQYTESDLKNFEIDFVRAVFTKFGKSDYYTSMTDRERENAFNELGNVLETYSYGNAADGFIDNCIVDMNTHEITCQLKGFEDYKIIWAMPGY